MSEHREKLRQTVADLEAELHCLDSLDTESRALLHQVTNDIHALLAKQEEPPHTPGSLRERLLTSVETFEAAHPTLAGLVHRVVDGLAQLGI